MKKIIAFILAVCLLFCFAGCQSGDTNETQNNNTSDEVKSTSNFSFTYQGVEMKLAQPAAPIIEKLGEPKKYTESASCAFEGLDKSYYYGSFYLETYPQGDEDYVYGWWFADDTVTTPEGIFIGSSKADVDAAYGAENFNGTNAYTVKDGDGTLTVILDKDVVTSIQYNLVVE